MFNFFTNNAKIDNCYHLDGENFNHAINVLRMSVGDKILISHQNASSLCQIAQIFDDYLVASILEEKYLETELDVEVYLFQGLPKADKLELIIQKAVELGASKIIPTQMARSVVKIEEKKKDAKTQRWQAIAESGAKQSKRNVIPQVVCPQSFKGALEIASKLDLVLVPYENANGMLDTKTALSQIQKGNKVGIFIGPEGGFDQKEIDLLKELNNTHIVSLGKRILRTETASITALAMVMLYCETNL